MRLDQNDLLSHQHRAHNKCVQQFFMPSSVVLMINSPEWISQHPIK